MAKIIIFSCLLVVGGVMSTTVTKLQPCTTPDSKACQVVNRFYDDYQQMKCLTAEQIKVLGKGKFVCEEPNKNCWYQDCQMRLTDLAFEGKVRPQCKCTDESRNYCQNKIDDGKKTCMKLERYESEQIVTCRRSQDLLTHTTGCPFPQTHCWFPCQSEKHHLESGRVSDECQCSTNDAWSLFTKWNTMLIVLSSLLVTIYLH